jgi:hypothetical protein
MIHYNVTYRSCIERTEGVRAVPNLMPAFQALDRAHTGYVDRQRFALALRKVRNILWSTVYSTTYLLHCTCTSTGEQCCFCESVMFICRPFAHAVQ